MMPRFGALPILLLLPLILRGGYALALLAVRERRLARFLAPGLALAVWLLAIHAWAMASQSYYVGLFAGTLVAAGIGYASRFIATPHAEDGPPISPWMFVGAILAVALLLGTEIRFHEHDECIVAGHLSFPLQMLNGIYPPRHLAFAQFELRYHYGFDLTSATAAALLGQPDMTLVVHGLTLVLFAYAFCLFWALGQRWIGGRFAGPVTAATVLFAGGFPFFCRELHPLGALLIGNCWPNGMWLLPPVPSNFVQHPWSLGYPLAACILMVFRLRRRHDPWWFAGLGVLFAFLSLSQFVLFSGLLTSVVIAGSIEKGRFSPGACLRFVVWAGAILLAARLMHGFLAPVAEPAQAQIEFHVFAEDWRSWLAWTLQSFGFLIPLGIAGFFLLRGERLPLVIFVLGALTVFNFSRRPTSWDIVKFAQLAQLGLAIASAATLQRLVSGKATRFLGMLGLALVTAFGITWPTALALDLPGLIYCASLPSRPVGPDRQAIEYIRHHALAGEMVFRSRDPQIYAIYGGLPQGSSDWGVNSFGFSEPLVRRRNELMAKPSAVADDYLSQSFRWFVLEPSDQEMIAHMKQWVSDGRAELRVQFPPLEVYYLSR